MPKQSSHLQAVPWDDEVPPPTAALRFRQPTAHQVALELERAVAGSALQKSTLRQVTPVEYAKAILGTDHIVLSDFDAPGDASAGMPPWLEFSDRPLAEHLDETGALHGSGGANDAVYSSFFAKARARTVMAVFVAALVLAVGLTAGLFAWHSSRAGEARGVVAANAAPWRVQSVHDRAVTVVYGGGRVQQVRVGEKLPDGQVLEQTDPARRLFRTPSAATLVRDDAPKQP